MKYRPYLSYLPVRLPDRTWPDRQITRAPVWCSVDLRDGNQALVRPMSVDQKLRLFNLLKKIGFKEIEIGFPSAAQVEFDFTRTLIEEDRIPADVTPQVLTQAREHLIERTFEALRGARRAIVHLYNSTSELQRRVVFRKGRREIIDLAVNGVRQIQGLAGRTDTQVVLEYSPESFTGTELDFALEICEAVVDVWKPTPARKMILNLPATVEMATPNVYADQIEWFCRNLRSRDSVIISLHTHNDRGAAVAATELGLLAGADRVEGTLFGNGERTGNVDLVTVALNMYSQGVDPGLDLQDLRGISQVARECTDLPIHERHPYAGELVFTAFSGSHQDAISKGMRARQESGGVEWEVPYLPIDPHDVGRTYEAVVRVNSQSGKGGAAYLVQSQLGCELPKAMHPEVSAVMQRVSEWYGFEIPASTWWGEFKKEYLENTTPYEFVAFHSKTEKGRTECRLDLKVDSDHGSEPAAPAGGGAGSNNRNNKQPRSLTGRGNGPIDACAAALLGEPDCPRFKLVDYHEDSLASGADATAAAFIQIELEDGGRKFGVGVDADINVAAAQALLSALNRGLVVVQPLHRDFTAYVMSRDFGYELPPRMQLEFRDVVQTATGKWDEPVPPATIKDVFQQEYLDRNRPYQFLELQPKAPSGAGVGPQPGGVECVLKVRVDGRDLALTGRGNGPVSACVDAIRHEPSCPPFQLVNYHEHARTSGEDARAAAFIELAFDGLGIKKFGAGLDPAIDVAAAKALLSAINRSFVPAETLQTKAAEFMDLEFKCELPRAMRPEFNALVRARLNRAATAAHVGLLWDVFQTEYLGSADRTVGRDGPAGRYQFVNFNHAADPNVRSGPVAVTSCELEVHVGGEVRTLAGRGNGPISACVNALQQDPDCPRFQLLDYHEHARTAGADAMAVAFIQVQVSDGPRYYGAGTDVSTTDAAIKALLSAVNRACGSDPRQGRAG